MLLSKRPLGRFLYHERCSLGGGVAAGALTPAEGSLSLEGAGFGAQGRKGAEINPFPGPAPPGSAYATSWCGSEKLC